MGPRRSSGRRRPVGRAASRARGLRVRRRAGWRTREQEADLLLIERGRRVEPVVIEVDRPQAFRPRPVGFWRGTEFHQIMRVVATRREHDATYHRVMTDRGAFEIRNIRRMDPRTLRVWRAWELCAEFDTVPVARRR